MQLSSMQKKFLDNCDHRWNIKEGATRSGKTYLDYFLIPRRIKELRGKPGLKFIVGNTQTTADRNVLEPMRNLFGEKHVKQIKKGSNTVEIFGDKFYVLGADKANQISKFQGAGFSYCYGDEIATWSEGVFQMIKSRLTYSYSRFDGTCNPDSPNHWFKKFLDSDADIFRQSYTIYDNPFLDESVKRNLEIEYAGTVFFDRYILGEWALAEGRIYANYDPKRDPVDEVPEALTGSRYIACDYGTQNPCVFLLFEEGVSGTWYLTEEYYYSGRDTHIQKTDAEYVSDFISFVNSRKINAVIADPSAASFITALKKAGFKVKKAKNDVRDGIREVAARFSTQRLKILKRCENTLNEIGSYAWDPKATEDSPLKENDHAMDALRYFVYTILKRKDRAKRKVNFLT